MNRKIILFSFIFISLLFSIRAEAATVHGKIYTMELEPALDVIIRINTTPQQMFISKDGFYSFEIPEGEYLIEAVVQSGRGRETAEENIRINDEGNYILDFLLFPDLSEEIDLAEENFDFSDITEKESGAEYYLSAAIPFTVVIVIMVVAYACYRKKKYKKKKSKEEKETDLSDKVLDFIKNEDGRTTQKEIRKQFPFSEAKISLVITELEDKGIIKKIKKGRGNVIVMNR